MTHDRSTGDAEDRAGCPYECRKGGWLTHEDAAVQRPCPIHRPRRTPNDSTAYDPTRYSARARAAIERAEANE